MAKINGTLVLFKLGDTPSTLAHIEESSMTIESELPENTDKDSAGFREILENGGVMSGSIDVSGYADWTATDGNAKELAQAVLGRENLGFAFGPEGATEFQVTGNCRAGSVELGAPNEDSATISGTFETTGEFQLVDNS